MSVASCCCCYHLLLSGPGASIVLQDVAGVCSQLMLPIVVSANCCCQLLLPIYVASTVLQVFVANSLCHTLLRFSKHSIKSQRVGLEIMSALFRAASRFLTNLIVCLGTSTENYLEPLTSYNASVKKCFTMRDDLPRLLKAKKVMSDFLNASTWHRYEAKNEHETKQNLS
jgi:hypothetical protein